MEKLGKYCEKMGEGLGECKKQHEEYREGYAGVRESVALLFKEMRDIVDREEEATLCKIREAYTYVVGYSDNRMLNFKRKLAVSPTR
jgi:hypothetical protein